MTITLHPYPAYRDSAVSWLGKIPSHWTTRRAKTLLTEATERAGSSDLELLSLSKSRGIVPQRTIGNRPPSASDFSFYRRVQPGQLVMNRMQAWNGLFGTSPQEGMISPDYAAFDVNEDASVAFIMRLVTNPLWIEQFAALSTGIGTGFNRLYTEDFGSVSLLHPPLNEQGSIVRFLDAMDARITRFIAARRRLIALREEQKRAIITQAVTCGLDPDVPLRDSGVPWLGKIPVHWEVQPLKRELRCLNQYRIPLSSTERGAMKSRRFAYYGASGVIDSVDEYVFDDELILIAEDGANLVLRNLPLAIIARGRF